MNIDQVMAGEQVFLGYEFVFVCDEVVYGDFFICVWGKVGVIVFGCDYVDFICLWDYQIQVQFGFWFQNSVWCVINGIVCMQVYQIFCCIQWCVVCLCGEVVDG